MSPTRSHRLPLLGLVPLGLFCLSAHADVKPYISAVTEYNTECKTCPRSLCPNKIAYGYSDNFNATCWTRGTKILDNNLWLKTDAGCYVTEYDVIEYAGDYKQDLAFCGEDSEEEHITTEDATLQYKSECRICPDLQCDVWAYLSEETDLTLTCWSDKGQVVIDDPYWLKTTNNCYVAEKSLYSKPDITYLDNCGPIPYLETLWHYNENGTSEVDKREPLPLPEPIQQSQKYLINVTVGEDVANCRECPRDDCRIQTKYHFNQEVWLQCLTETNGTWWSETTDFCYVKDSDFWESPEGDYYMNPRCESFSNPDDNE